VSSIFGGVSYFDSGPERFQMGRRGELVRGPFVSPNTFPVSSAYGTDIELVMLQTGRLTNASAAGLWADVDTIVNRAENFAPGTLVDTFGRSFTNMFMLRFTPGETVDVGRVVSMAYSVFYLRFG